MTMYVLGESGSNNTNYHELRGLLDRALPGDIVYVDDALEIRCDEGTDVFDDGTTRELVIKAGVTLASGRGKFIRDPRGRFSYSQGAKLFVTYDNVAGGGHATDSDGNPTGVYSSFIRLSGDDARLVGVRISGPDVNVLGIRANMVAVVDANRCTIESCDFRSVPGTGVGFGRSIDSVVRNCSFVSFKRFNENPALGIPRGLDRAYPIFVGTQPTFILVEGNYFQDNWHGVASNGEFETGYEARGNFIDDPHGSAFDVHLNQTGTVIDGSDQDDEDDIEASIELAFPTPDRVVNRCTELPNRTSQYIYIHCNVFMNNSVWMPGIPQSNGNPRGGVSSGVLVRGCPAQSCIVDRNFFAQNEQVAIKAGTRDDYDLGSKLICDHNIFNFSFPFSGRLQNQYHRTVARMMCTSTPPAPPRFSETNSIAAEAAARLNEIRRESLAPSGPPPSSEQLLQRVRDLETILAQLLAGDREGPSAGCGDAS
ncbi:hypothetical protein [Paludisphaera soli]|uniref:hypothetical protein n=1 Tax=Paludisphaera soli TaxID=2712865 RepID=UPI0013EC2580|nr:hypothetical protein [Paludisphaera soli]